MTYTITEINNMNKLNYDFYTVINNVRLIDDSEILNDIIVKNAVKRYNEGKSGNHSKYVKLQENEIFVQCPVTGGRYGNLTCYYVSQYGNIIRKKINSQGEYYKMMNGWFLPKGYRCIDINKGSKIILVSRLVALTWLNLPDGETYDNIQLENIQVHHRDEIKSNKKHLKTINAENKFRDRANNLYFELKGSHRMIHKLNGTPISFTTLNGEISKRPINIHTLEEKCRYLEINPDKVYEQINQVLKEADKADKADKIKIDEVFEIDEVAKVTEVNDDYLHFEIELDEQRPVYDAKNGKIKLQTFMIAFDRKRKKRKR